MVKKAPGFQAQELIDVTGEVKYSGSYMIRNKNQRISDLLEITGGLTNYAFLEGATLNRYTSELGRENIAIDLNKIIKEPGSQSDLFLRNGDSLNIPQIVQTVKVSGLVQHPFSLSYEKGKDVKHYINKTGGFDSNAIKRKVYDQYANGSTAATKISLFLIPTLGLSQVAILFFLRNLPGKIN